MGKDYQQLWVAATNATDGGQATHTMAEILADTDGKVFLLRLDSNDVESCIEMLGDVSSNPRLPPSQPQAVSQGIAEHNLRPAENQAFFVMLGRLAERHGLLPSCMRIAGKVEVSGRLLASNRFADLTTGTYGEHLVAIKTLRITARDDYVKIRKVSTGVGHPGYALSAIPIQRVCKGVVLWNTLSHPNILKLVGVQEDMNNRQFSIVSEWMSNGNIMEFIENNHANRLELVRGITSPRHSLR